jgi:hypothetical protein
MKYIKAITRIKTILNKIVPKKPHQPLGRWKIENCNTAMNYKIDLSNEDHCGPCGQYAMDKMEKIQYVKHETKNKKSDL